MGELDEPVHLAPHDPRWPQAAAAEASRILAALGGEVVAAEHVGSTAVPGLIAKPIIDLMVGLGTYPPAATLIKALHSLGYESLGEAGVSGRTYLRLRQAKGFNLHLVQHAGTHWTMNLALREYLLRSASARQRYAAAKEDALTAGARNLLAYSARKAATVQALLHEALRNHGDA